MSIVVCYRERVLITKLLHLGVSQANLRRLKPPFSIRVVHWLSRRSRKDLLRSAPIFLIGLGLLGCQPLGLIAPPPQDGLGSNSLNSSFSDQQPQLSFNGQFLVFTSERDKRRSIYLYDLTARRLIPLPNLNQAGNYLEQPDISADGRLITFMAERNGKSNIWLYDRERRQAQNLTQTWQSSVRNPSISGDGRWIVFESNLNGQWDLVIYDRGSNNIRPLNPGQAFESGASP